MTCAGRGGRRLTGGVREERPGMDTVGVLAKFEFKAGNEAAVERFFRQGQLVVQGQPETTQWFAYRLGTTTYGAFATFANEEDRDALLSAGGPRSSRENADLFEHPPSFEKVDIVAARTVV
jgi:hypothetical protein